MYTHKLSTKVTLFISYAFTVLLIILMIFGRNILEWYYGVVMMDKTVDIVMYTFYSCCPMAFVTLGCVIKLLKNVLKEEIFSETTVKILRIISWCCALVTVACTVSGCFYPAFFIFALGAAFMMLILRVLKNVMAKAVEIKNENELTI